MLRYFSRKYLSFEDLTRPEEDELVLTVREKHITRKPLVLGPGIEKFFDDIPTTPELGYRSKMAKAFSGSLLDLNAMNASDEDVDGPWGDGSSFGERSPYQSFSGREALGHSFSEGMISTPPLSPPKTVYQGLLAEVARHTSVSRTMDGDRVMRYSFSSGLPQIVAVWGAHTFLGAHVLSALLEEGFWVRAVVALEKVAEIQELVGLIGDEARIKLYPIPEHKNESNAFERSAYDEILSGCSFVINTLVASLTQAEWIYASASELLNAMTSHVSKPLRRYVFTGSVNCLSCFNEGDENHYERYMDACTPENTDPVQFARIQAEKDASFWGLQNNIDVVTLLPSVMIGPARTRSASESVRMIGNIALGNKKWCLPFAPKVYWNFVDVRDVARMHVNALQCILSPETQKAISRCFIVAHHQDTKYSQLSKAIRHACPVLTPPIYDLPNWITLLVAPLLVSVSRPTIRQFRLTLGKRNVFNVQRAQRELNFSPVPLHQTIQDMLSDLVDLGIIALTPHTQISSRSHRVTSACLSFLSIVTGTLVLGLLFRSRYV